MQKKRGKVPQLIDWPQGVFTAEQVHNTVANAMSRVSVHTKINKALEDGELTRVGKSKPSLGRPKVQYQRNPSMDMETM